MEKLNVLLIQIIQSVNWLKIFSGVHFPSCKNWNWKEFRKLRSRQVPHLTSLALDLAKTEELRPNYITIPFCKYTWLTSARKREISSIPCSLLQLLQTVLIFFSIHTLFIHPKRKKQTLLLISLNIWLR